MSPKRAGRTLVALFRGINVGGKNPLPMKELRAILEELGAASVSTYIQSGNAVFSSAERDLAALAGRVGALVAERRGFEPEVLLLSTDDLERAMSTNPFRRAEADPKRLHLGFLSSQPKTPDLEGLEALRAPSERFALVGRVFYLHAPEGVGRSKLAARAERLLGVAMTDRNWRTVCRLQEMASELS